MYAVVGTVAIAPGQFENARKALHDDVVPRVRKAPGFVKGYWTIAGDRANGVSMLLFNSQADAENAAKMARGNPMPSGVTFTSIDVREVVAEA